MRPEPVTENELRLAVRDVPDYPKPGIVFKDITPLLADARLFSAACDVMAQPYQAAGITHVVAIESRGFVFGGVVAASLGAGFVPVRKVGKLPFKTERVEYALEYGSDALEVHVDALGPGAKVLVVDDVLATGGTASAAISLVQKLGGAVIGCTFLIRLSFLPGLAALAPVPCSAALVY
ncbi:MAG: adenine phosphoribosyltransferase [Gemmatimonadaceae bacterium]